MRFRQRPPHLPAETSPGAAGFIVRHRYSTLLVTLLVVLLGGVAGSALFSSLSAGGWHDPGAESGQAAELLDRAFGQTPPNLVILATAPDGVDEPGTAAAGATLTESLVAEPGVDSVVSYWSARSDPSLRNAAGDKALILAKLVGDETVAEERLTEVKAEYGDSWAGLGIEYGGYAAFQQELTEQSERDVMTAELIVFPVLLVVLVLVFGSLVAAVLPVLIAMITVVAAMGVLWLLAQTTELSVFAVNIVTLLGLGLAVDYSLLMINRFREASAGGVPAAQAVLTTLRTAGRAVVFSAVTVAVSMAALAWFPLAALRSVSYGGIATALLAGAASLTVLPVLLLLLGHRVDSGRVPWRRPSAPAGTGFWHRLAGRVMRRPVPFATASIALLMLLGLPFLGLRLGEVDERTMPESAESRQVATMIRAEFDTGAQNAVQIAIPDGGTDAELAGYATAVSELAGVARVDAPTGAYADGVHTPPGAEHSRFTAGDSAYLTALPEPAEPEQLQQLVRDLRALPAPFETLVGGTAAQTVDGNAALVDRLPVAGACLALAMIVLLFLLTGSAVLPFVAVLLSMASLTATFGALVWIFQDGHLSGLLGGFTATGSLAGTIPVMLFAVAFGLAMDYQVFLLSRIKEEHDRTGDTTVAVTVGLERIGRIVTAAAVLISIVFLAFLFSELTLMKAFGVGLPLAVLLDATVVRGVLLPAVMQLGGRWTWWAPGPLRRLHRRYGVRAEESPDDAVARKPVSV